MENDTLTTLTNVYGFPADASARAVAALGKENERDVESAINWLLDHGCEDKGGPVHTKWCSHVDSTTTDFLLTPAQLAARPFVRPCEQGCKSGETWTCLSCGVSSCSRYVKKHMLAHYNETKAAQEAGVTVAALEQGAVVLPRGHFLALSQTDLSIWCYECNAYVFHPALRELATCAEALKHPATTTGAAGAAAGAAEAAAAPATARGAPEVSSAVTLPRSRPMAR